MERLLPLRVDVLVVRENPALPSKLPISEIAANGEMWGPTPPWRSDSARMMQFLNSCSVPSPNMLAMKMRSSFNNSRHFVIVPGRSLTQCRARLDVMTSNDLSAKGSDSSSPTTLQRLGPRRKYIRQYAIHAQSSSKRKENRSQGLQRLGLTNIPILSPYVPFCASLAMSAPL